MQELQGRASPGLNQAQAEANIIHIQSWKKRKLRNRDWIEKYAATDIRRVQQLLETQSLSSCLTMIRSIP